MIACRGNMSRECRIAAFRGMVANADAIAERAERAVWAWGHDVMYWWHVMHGPQAVTFA